MRISALTNFGKEYSLSSANFYTFTNPKTEKNSVPTLVLHLEPVTGGVCPAAGTCAALCLHKAGNPAYMEVKTACRKRRTQAWLNDPTTFKQYAILQAAKMVKKGYRGIRLNGTSDIAWEMETVKVDKEFAQALYAECGVSPAVGERGVIEVLNLMGYMCYDYTKRIDRNFKLCRAIGYHLTLSWGGKFDDQVFTYADLYGLNVAAPIYGVKKKQALPAEVTVRGEVYPVVDGDVTDWRRDDPKGRVHVIGLRLKRTPGQDERRAKMFCV